MAGCKDAPTGVAALSSLCACMLLQADKLLSPEFEPVIADLIRQLPKERQILLYSATFPVMVKQFKDKFLKKPYIINLMEELTLKGLTQVGKALRLVLAQCCALAGQRPRPWRALGLHVLPAMTSVQFRFPAAHEAAHSSLHH